MNDESTLAKTICVCTGNHDPERRVECRYARDAARRVLTSDWLRDQAAAAATRARAEALRLASLDLDVPTRGTIDGVRVVRLIDVTAWLRDEAMRRES